MQFSDTTNNTGILQRARKLARVDSTQWETFNVVNSCNDWLDKITGFALAKDKNFQWDDTNHTALPEGTAQLTINVSDYAFTVDQQGNKILTLLGVSVLQNGKYEALKLVDRNDPDYDPATFGTVSGTPTQYDKIADNIIRLDKLPPATVASGIKFYFQRSPSYFAATDTTKEPGVAIVLHRGFVVASAYDAALTLGLDNLQALSVELQKEEMKMITYFSGRNNDMPRRMKPAYQNNR